MGTVAYQITSLSIVYSTVYSDADPRKHQSSASLAFVHEIHRGPVKSPHKWPITRKCFHLMTSSCPSACIVPPTKANYTWSHYRLLWFYTKTRYCRRDLTFEDFHYWNISLPVGSGLKLIKILPLTVVPVRVLKRTYLCCHEVTH